MEFPETFGPLRSPNTATPPQPIEVAATPLPVEEVITVITGSMNDQEPEPAAITSDITNIVDDSADEHYSELGENDGEYIPDVQDDVDSDDNLPLVHNKNVGYSDVVKSKLEEEVAGLHNWEAICIPLIQQAKKEPLSGMDLTTLKNAHQNMTARLKKVSSDDPMWSHYAGIVKQCSSFLRTPKRKGDHATSSQNKKPRISKQIQKRGPATRGPATRGPATRGPATRQQATVSSLVSIQVSAVTTKFKKLAPPDVDPKQLKAEARHLDNAATRVGEKLEGAEVDAWLIKNMRTTLFNYQFDALGWALRRERGRLGDFSPKGGILADGMGCGKTITMLALIVAKPAPASDRIKADLVVVPSTEVADQWAQQIRQHCTDMESVRYKNIEDPAVLRKDKIIVATYHELQAASTRVLLAAKKKETLDKDDIDGHLFKVTFHRLLLDECHSIKNYHTNTAKAVFKLQSRFRWLISATPTPNDADEYYPYLRVLGLRNTGSLSDFKRFWMTPAEGHPRAVGKEAKTNLEVGLETFQLRRTGLTAIAGVKIFANVPTNHQETRHLDYPDDERSIYTKIAKVVREDVRKGMSKRSKQKANRDINGSNEEPQDGESVGDFYTSKILQLAKLTAHPFLLETIMHGKNFTLEQRLEVRNVMKLSGKPLLTRLDGYVDRVDAETPSSDADRVDAATQSSDFVSDSAPGDEHLNIGSQLKFNIGEKAIDFKCGMCKGATVTAEVILTECGCRFCRNHFARMFMDQDDVEFERPMGSDPIRCLICDNSQFTFTKIVDQTDLVEAQKYYNQNAKLNSGKRKLPKNKAAVRKRGDDFNGYQPKGERNMWLEISDKEHPRVPLPHGVKTREILDTILAWQNKDPDDKIIVFTQWIVMGKIIGRFLEDAKIPFLYNFSGLSVSERSKNLKTFKENKKIKVIVMGLKCAGQGLDLHCACRVILVDPYWNNSVEEQALARVYRKIQTKETYGLRLLVRRSIDTRISVIQERKEKLIQELMKEDNPLRRQEMEQRHFGFLDIMLDDDIDDDIIDDEAAKLNEDQAARPRLPICNAPAPEAHKQQDVTKKRNKKLKLNYSERAALPSAALTSAAKPKAADRVISQEVTEDTKEAELDSTSSYTTEKPADATPMDTDRIIKQEDMDDVMDEAVETVVDNDPDSLFVN